MANRNRALTALGKSIRQRRTELGLSQQQLAAKADIDRSYLSEVERGVRNVSLLTVVRIAKALGTTIAALLREATFDRRGGSEGR